MTSLRSGVKLTLMKKPIKFKDNICSVKQYAQIIFQTKNIKNEDDFLYGMVPKNWKIQRTIFEGKKVDAYYNGKLSKGKNEGSEIGLGIDHVINDNVYVFVEYHMSDEYCAYDVTEGNGNGGYDNNGDDELPNTVDDIIGNEVYGCQVLSVGTHYSF